MNDSLPPMQCDPIAVVRSCFGGKFVAPRQPGLCPSAWGELVFHKPFRSWEAIRGIEGFSHLWIIFGFHETAEKGWHATVRPPRLGGEKRVGVFASRSTFRPNALGLSLVRLEGIEADGPDAPVLKLGGLDLIDGTPVYDVKPYLPYAESPPDAVGGFAPVAPNRIPVEVDSAAEEAFRSLPFRAQSVIREALSLDPRPASQKATEERIYGASLCGRNVRFVVNSGVCRILEIETMPVSGLND
ncbi:tRNA (N6-threonylcarbamoyladenosine(37)-N6)-methyltransferase TrmO [Luteolibacter pohnpeiensis]|uniref:tRNA (N6-threonylcarbamoyladenosine(37)-N6)-methyltransferase TrmO n=1 Tax=Luteolibacter pohnpeiensis TaxID=454153 RepID=A0A934S5X3_9BACT|nr:tRNA (N6-threonylcarbamoyladenosine(37)-N6)-methyltransferase TrmO [Luteolibacter pohnpeiensis]MBK1881356.1 tRNA (N6-threonylcarbamoyladenosine(37)-N6)-methyltransferase TrmO [Luteolibacter pohnpeiensis]